MSRRVLFASHEFHLYELGEACAGRDLVRLLAGRGLAAEVLCAARIDSDFGSTRLPRSRGAGSRMRPLAS